MSERAFPRLAESDSFTPGPWDRLRIPNRFFSVIHEGRSKAHYTAKQQETTGRLHAVLFDTTQTRILRDIDKPAILQMRGTSTSALSPPEPTSERTNPLFAPSNPPKNLLRTSFWQSVIQFLERQSKTNPPPSPETP